MYILSKNNSFNLDALMMCEQTEMQEDITVM